MTDEINEPNHRSELERLRVETSDKFYGLASIISTAFVGDYAGGIDWQHMKRVAVTAIDDLERHIHPEVAQGESAEEARSSDPDAPVQAARWQEKTIGIPRELVAQAINTLAQGMAGQLTASESQMAAATAVIDNIKYGPFVVDEGEAARQKQINDALSRAIAEEKKAFEDRILKGTDAPARDGGGDYNFVVNPPWVHGPTVVPSGWTGNAMQPAGGDDDDSETYVERQKAEAARISTVVANQPSWVPRAVGEGRALKCGHCLVEITRLPSPGDTGEYYVEVHGPKDPWGKETVPAIGRTVRFSPYWASERMIWLNAMDLLGDIGYKLYPDEYL